MLLNDTRLLEKTVPPLAKQFGLTKEAVWEVLENQSDSLQKLIAMQRDSRLRGDVNEWWRRNRHRFSNFGMVQFVKVEPKNLPQSTYEQVICLMWLTSALKVKPMVKLMQKTEVKIPKPPAPISRRQKLMVWFKNWFT
jgi:hypothetical protein